MKSNSKVFIPILCIFLFFYCSNTKESTPSFNGLDYFLANANQAGFIIRTDTTFKYPSLRTRQIRIDHAVSYAAVGFRPFEILIKFNQNIKTLEGFNNIGFPIEKDSDGLVYLRRIDLAKHEDTTQKDWTAVFFTDNCLYQTNTRDFTHGGLLWFARKFKSIVLAKTHMPADSIFLAFKKDSETASYYIKVQSFFRNYSFTTTTQNREKALSYSGKTLRFPGDALSPKDSANFRDCVIKFRQQHGLDSSFTIDSSLLTALKISLRPIEDGLRTFRTQNKK